jgi:hypothetical protein
MGKEDECWKLHTVFELLNIMELEMNECQNYETGRQCITYIRVMYV